MNTREISDGRHEWLAGEMESWTAQGLLTGDQAARILGLYGSPEERSARRGGQAVSAITSLATLLVGLGVLLLVAFNWMVLPAALKIVLVVAAMLASHAGGWFLRFRMGRRAASDALFFLGCLFYGGAIWQTAQVFNITVASNTGFWWWAVGSLPFALASRSLALHGLVAAILATYTGLSTVGWFFSSGGSSERLSDPAFSIPLLALPGLIWAYGRKSAGGVGMYVMLLTWWVLVQPTAWRLDDAPIFWVGSVGALLLLIAECHPARSPLAIPYRTFGVLLTGGVLLLLGVYTFNSDALGRVMPTPLVIETAVAAVVAVGLVVLAAELERRRAALSNSGSAPRVGNAFLDERRRIPLGLVLLMAAMGFWNALVGTPLAPTIAANVAMLALSLWLMMVGLREERGRPFTAGVLYFLTWAVCRYVDMFGDFGGMVGAALMFFLCGAALFGVARFWQRRSRKGSDHA
ncbi:MAG: DUF2157 domain-containing protein [Paludisphaera borealis]|uniref:DUF2157 domain-containing protein n=1 Tax=Paludisphaera borealis TaxID=1387353 RepID=UPI002846A03C|nr:DUF2157 domain-containing protein [Paludisphaera borealis]MDR3619672.1 DUF2157 domain-containing protein [Paludisphaera borealis]